MTTCYNCLSNAIHAVNLKMWKPVCEDCSAEAIKEEEIIEVMSITRWENEQGVQTKSA